MAGTNIFAIKRALFGWLAELPDLADDSIQVAYSWPGVTLERECIYGGDASAAHKFAAITSGRKPRDEAALIAVHVEVIRPGGTVEETDRRAEQIGAVLETLLADNVALGGSVPGLRYGGTQTLEAKYALSDDAVETTLTYSLLFSSRLF